MGRGHSPAPSGSGLPGTTTSAGRGTTPGPTPRPPTAFPPLTRPRSQSATPTFSRSQSVPRSQGATSGQFGQFGQFSQFGQFGQFGQSSGSSQTGTEPAPEPARPLRHATGNIASIIQGTGTDSRRSPPAQAPPMSSLGQMADRPAPIFTGLTVDPYLEPQTPQQVTPTGTSLHRLAVEGGGSGSGGRGRGRTPAAGRGQSTNNSPGSPFVGAQESVPTAFWEPTRDNLIRLQDQPLPELRWDMQNHRCVISAGDEEFDINLELGGIDNQPEANLPTNATPEESRRIKYYTQLMLFLWHSSRFAGYYARKVNENIPTNSERFIQIINSLKYKFKTAKSHFLWRHAYAWVKELALDNPQLVDYLNTPEGMRLLQTELISKLDQTSFNAVFHHVRYIIDFRRTKQENGHGYYFITTIWLNLIVCLLRLWASESVLNRTGRTDDLGRPEIALSNFGRAAWKRDATLRETTRERFTAWALLEELRYANEPAFAKLAQEMRPTPAVSRVDVRAARDGLLLPRPPPPPPPGSRPQFSYGLPPAPPAPSGTSGPSGSSYNDDDYDSFFGTDGASDDPRLSFKPMTWNLRRSVTRPRIDTAIFQPLGSSIRRLAATSQTWTAASDVFTDQPEDHQSSSRAETMAGSQSSTTAADSQQS
ncbi:hypothetical protein V8C44DRAFT_322190 [Trichoderma aethiopicum]